MKKILLLLAVTMALTNSCSKGSSSPGGGGNNGGGGGNGGGNGGNTGGITITAVTPANLYPDDQITITGTGFNADASKDTVEFGHLVNGNFGAWHDGLSTQWPSLCTVISATATQLVIKAVNPVQLDYSAFPSGPSIAVIQVRTGGKKAVTPVIPFKRLLQLNGISNPDYFTWSIGRPYDSLVINGKGFAKAGVSVSIDGTPLTNLKIDSTDGYGTIALRLPKTFFGMGNDESIMVQKVMTLSNPDGKTVQKSFNFLLSPQMRIYTMQSEFPTYSLSGLNGSGGVIKVFVNGRSLKNDAVVKLGSVTIQTESGLQVNGFPDNTVITFTPGSLVPGNYQVNIERNNALYGICNFRVNQ